MDAWDPTGEKARAVKARYVGLCRGCGAYTQPRNGKGDAYAYCKACHPGAIEARWTTERVRDAMCDWRARYGRLPTSYDWSRTHSRRRGGPALERLAKGEWPAASVVTALFGRWAAARAATAVNQVADLPGVEARIGLRAARAIPGIHEARRPIPERGSDAGQPPTDVARSTCEHEPTPARQGVRHAGRRSRANGRRCQGDR
jgi:hypothetical protein